MEREAWMTLTGLPVSCAVCACFSGGRHFARSSTSRIDPNLKR